jgi:hypothetical protein
MSEHRERFYTEGSPLKGHHVPPDWRLLDRTAKWQALVDNQIARTMDEARSLLAKHAAAIGKIRRAQAKKGGRYGR